MTTEVLFEREAELRNAARAYAANANEQTRKELRASALIYARFADAIDKRGK